MANIKCKISDLSFTKKAAKELERILKENFEVARKSTYNDEKITSAIIIHKTGDKIPLDSSNPAPSWFEEEKMVSMKEIILKALKLEITK